MKCFLERAKYYIVAGCRLSFHLALPPALRAPELSQNAFTSHVHWTRTCSRPPGTVETFLRDFGAQYKCTDSLTYLQERLQQSAKRHKYVVTIYLCFLHTCLEVHVNGFAPTNSQM